MREKYIDLAIHKLAVAFASLDLTFHPMNTGVPGDITSYWPVNDVIWNYDVRNYPKYLILSTDKNNLNWIMQNTSVLHFCGKHKPWQDDYKNPFGILYLHYLNRMMRKIK